MPLTGKIRDLCQRIIDEKDSKKMFALAAELDAAFDEQKRLQPHNTNAASAPSSDPPKSRDGK